MSCKYCTEYEDLPEHIVNGKPIGKIFDTCIQADEHSLWHIELPSGLDIGIKFCPYCGRKFDDANITFDMEYTINASHKDQGGVTVIDDFRIRSVNVDIKE